VTLTQASYTIGSDPESVDIELADTTVSDVHAILERVGKAWLIRDLASTNGTRLDGKRLTGQRRLRDGDEMVLGLCRLRFHDGTEVRRRSTDALQAPPDLTRRQRDVLIELCRPLMSHNSFQPPASVREIADRLFISKNAVQNHLESLYNKFEVYEADGLNRRVVLANEAVQRGAVSIADLTDHQDPRT
jgi:hypothetical protein